MPLSRRKSPNVLYYAAVALAVFRFLVGMSLLKHFFSIRNQKMLQALVLFPAIHFRYSMFEWVAPVSEQAFENLLVVMIILCISFSFGLFYRASTVLLFASYSYVFLLEKTWFVNHHYLYVLLLFAFTITDCHAVLSVDAFRAQRRIPGKNSLHRTDSGRSTAMAFPAAWALPLFQFLFVVVYFYGGVAKLNSDWMIRSEPLATWFFKGSFGFGAPLLGRGVLDTLGPEVVAWLALAGSWFGMAVDLIGGPALLWSRSRPFALICQTLFHLLNMQIFSIESFPWTMLASTALWLDWGESGPLAFVRRLSRGIGEPAEAAVAAQQSVTTRHRVDSLLRFVLFGVATVFVAVQAAVPLRHHYLGQDIQWTNDGALFSWRMMLNHEETLIRYLVQDQAESEAFERGTGDPPDSYSFSPVAARMSAYQRQQMKKDPLMISQFARDHVEPHARRHHGVQVAKIRADIWRSLNGRPFQRWFRPDMDATFLARCYHPIYGLLGNRSCMVRRTANREKPSELSTASMAAALLPRLEEVNTFEWLQYLEAWRAAHLTGASSNVQVVFFADSADSPPWQLSFDPKFATRVEVHVLRGMLTLTTPSILNDDAANTEDTTELRPGDSKVLERELPWFELDAVATTNTTCWAFTIHEPRMQLADALQMT